MPTCEQGHFGATCPSISMWSSHSWVALLWVSNISWPIVTHLYVPQAKHGRQSLFPANKSKPLNYVGVQATWIPLHACHGFEGVCGLQNVLAVFLLDSGYAAWGVVVAEMPALLLMSCPFFELADFAPNLSNKNWVRKAGNGDP